jgi:L,D-transpeptidase catalytic domain
MRGTITILTLTAILLLSRSSIGNAGPNKSAKTFSDYEMVADRYEKSQSAAKAQNYIDSMRDWLEENGYSTELMFVADMSLRMNIKRFYAVNPDSQKLLKAFIVAHGSGGGSTLSNAVFSNIPGSLCTSEGRYRIGDPYTGNYGKSYRLHGLDRTNSNALSRLIVFHSYRDQTDKEYSGPNYFSSGCPMVAKSSFNYCDSLIQLQNKPVLMVIYK